MNADKENEELKEALGSSDLNQFRALTKKVIEENVSKRKIAQRFKLYFASAAAIFLILIIYWWSIKTDLTIHEALFSQYFNPPGTINLIRDASQNQSPEPLFQLQKRIDSLYQIKEYGTAILILQAIKKEDPQIESSDYYFWLGLLQLLNNQAIEAIDALGEIEVGYTYNKPWYLALAYLKAGKITFAKVIFNDIAQLEGPYQQDAINILKTI